MTTLLTLLFTLPLVGIFILFASGKSFFSDAGMPESAERKAKIRMAELETIKDVRELIRHALRVFCIVVVFAGCTCFYGVAPSRYLLASVVVGVVWSGVIVLSWRLRSGVLRTSSLMVFILGQQILWHRLGGNQTFAMLQGGFVAIAAGYAMMLLLRPWLYKFARLEVPVAK